MFIPSISRQLFVQNLWAGINSKAALVHGHAQGDVVNLVGDLAGKAPTVHTHAQGDVTNLGVDLAAKAPIPVNQTIPFKLQHYDGAKWIDYTNIGGSCQICAAFPSGVAVDFLQTSVFTPLKAYTKLKVTYYWEVNEATARNFKLNMISYNSVSQAVSVIFNNAAIQFAVGNAWALAIVTANNNFVAGQEYVMSINRNSVAGQILDICNIRLGD